MAMMLTIIFIVLCTITLGQSLEIPSASVYLPDVGVLLEPEGMMIHQDRFVYNTVGITMASNYGLDKIKENCTSPLYKNNVESLNAIIDQASTEYLSYLPKHLSKLTFDQCGISLNPNCDDIGIKSKNKRSSDHEMMYKNTSVSPSRQKRGFIMALGLIAGLTAVGSALFIYFSKKDLEDHIHEVERNQDKIIEFQKTFSSAQEKYHMLSDKLFLKVHDSLSLMYKQYTDIACDYVDNMRVLDMKMNIAMSMDRFNTEIWKAIEGQVTEYLVTHYFLSNTIINNPLLQDTIYQQDVGMFYSLSKSFLIGHNIDTKTVFFLVATPIIRVSDVSPVFNVLNIGWISNNIYHEMSLPERVFSIRGTSRRHLAEMPTKDCVTKNGIHVCNGRYNILSEDTNCLNDLLANETTPKCDIKVSKEKPDDIIQTTRSGVLIRGKHIISTSEQIRGNYIRGKSVETSENYTNFYPYSEFQTLHVGDIIVNSLYSNIQVHTIKVYNKTNFDLPIDKHQAIPDFGTVDLSDRLEAHEEEIKARDILDDLKNHHKDHGHWYTYSVIVVVILIIGVIIYVVRKKDSFSKYIKAKYLVESHHPSTLPGPQYIR